MAKCPSRSVQAGEFPGQYKRARVLPDGRHQRKLGEADLSLPNDECLTEKAYGMFKAEDKDGFLEFEQDVRKEQDWVKAVVEKRRENKQEIRNKAKIRKALFMGPR